jgi:hypothetical protein
VTGTRKQTRAAADVGIDDERGPHSGSGLPGGTVELIVAAKAASLLISVIDNGSDVRGRRMGTTGGEGETGCYWCSLPTIGFASHGGHVVGSARPNLLIPCTMAVVPRSRASGQRDGDLQ